MIVSIMRGFLGACAAITSGLAVCYVLLQALVGCILIRCSFNGSCLLLLAGPLFSALHLISPMSCDNQRRGQPVSCPRPWTVSAAGEEKGCRLVRSGSIPTERRRCGVALVPLCSQSDTPLLRTRDIFLRYMPSAPLTLRADREINLCDVLAADVPCLTVPPLTTRQQIDDFTLIRPFGLLTFRLVALTRMQFSWSSGFANTNKYK